MQSAVDGADSVQRDARLKKMQDGLSAEENRVMDYIRARQLLRTEDSMHIDNFSTDVINGLAPNVKRGKLTLVKAVPLAKQGLKTTQTIG